MQLLPLSYDGYRLMIENLMYILLIGNVSFEIGVLCVYYTRKLTNY